MFHGTSAEAAVNICREVRITVERGGEEGVPTCTTCMTVCV